MFERVASGLIILLTTDEPQYICQTAQYAAEQEDDKPD